MNYSYLGRTGLKVSRIGLGTMNFGMETSEAESLAVLDAAADAGINFVDTADVFGGPQSPDIKQGYGISEEYIGRWLAQDAGRRDKIVLATKLYQPTGTGPTDRGLSAYHIRKAVRGQPSSAEDRPHRPVPDASCRPKHAVGGDLAGDGAAGDCRQGDLPRQQQLRRLADRHRAGRCRLPPLHGLVSEQSLYNLSARTIEWRSSLRCGTSVWDSFRTVRWAAASPRGCAAEGQPGPSCR